MTQFLLGVLLGIIIMGTATIYIPLQFTGVQKELVKQNHGQYNPTTREFTLKECK